MKVFLKTFLFLGLSTSPLLAEVSVEGEEICRLYGKFSNKICTSNIPEEACLEIFLDTLAQENGEDLLDLEEQFYTFCEKNNAA
jgi:hypothetical protein